MDPRVEIKMFVVDVLRHNVSQFTSIRNLMNDRDCLGWRGFWPHDFSDEEIREALHMAITEGLVDAFETLDAHSKGAPTKLQDVTFEVEYDRSWYDLSKKGWSAWDEWDPPLETTD